MQITAPRTTYSLFAVVDRRDIRDHRWSRHGFGGRGIVGISTCGELREVEAGFEGYNTYGLVLFGQYNARYGLEIPPEIS